MQTLIGLKCLIEYNFTQNNLNVIIKVIESLKSLFHS